MRTLAVLAAIWFATASVAAAQGVWTFYSDPVTGTRGAAVCPIDTATDYLCFEIGCTADGGLDFVVAAPAVRLPYSTLEVYLQVDGHDTATLRLIRVDLGEFVEFRAPVAASQGDVLVALERGRQGAVTLVSGGNRFYLPFSLTGSMRAITQARAQCGTATSQVNILNQPGGAPGTTGVNILNRPASQLVTAEPQRGIVPDPPSPGPAVSDPLAAGFAVIEAECDQTTTLEPGFATQVDLNGDARPDIMLDYGFATCGNNPSWFCGTGGCRTALYVAQADGTYVPVFDDVVRRLDLDNAPDLVFGLHGSRCGLAGVEPCTAFWRVEGGRLVAD